MRRATIGTLLALSACTPPEGPLEADLAMYIPPMSEELTMKLETHETKLQDMERDALLAPELPQLPPVTDPVPRDLSQWHATVIANAAPATLRALQVSVKAKIAELKSRLAVMPVSYDLREQKFRLGTALKVEEQKLEVIESEIALRG